MRVTRLPQRPRIEALYGRPLIEVLLDLAYRQGLTQLQVAERLQVPEGTVHSWFLRLGIQAGQLAQDKAHELLESWEEVS